MKNLTLFFFLQIMLFSCGVFGQSTGKAAFLSPNTNFYIENPSEDLVSALQHMYSDGTIVVKDDIDITESFLLDAIKSPEGSSYELSRERKSRFNEDVIYLRYQQYHKELEVKGGGYVIRIEKDKVDGHPVISRFSPHIFYDIDVDIVPKVVKEDLPSLLCTEEEVSSKLVISDQFEYEYLLLWEVEYEDSFPKVGWIDAQTGDLLKSFKRNTDIQANLPTYGQQNLVDFTENGVTSLRSPDDRIRVFENNVIPTTTNTVWGVEATGNALQALHATTLVVPPFLNAGIDFGTVNVTAIPGEGAFALLGSTVEDAEIELGFLEGRPTSLFDVVAHELGHVFLFQFLEYTNEEGNRALHEGIADIFGKYIESFIFPFGNNWVIGQDEPAVAARINRNLAQIACLDDLRGAGRHQIGRTIGHWYFVLTTGIPEDGIASLGLQNTIDILIESLNGLNNPNAGFDQMRMQTLITASDVFGPCSEIYTSIVNAWDRVCVQGEFEECNCNPTEDRLISNNTVVGGIRNFGGNLIVQSGATLTLNDANIGFSPGRGIVVNSGGSLIIENSRIGSCDEDDWSGIIVESGGQAQLENSYLDRASTGVAALDNSQLSIDDLWIVGSGNSSQAGLSLGANVNTSVLRDVSVLYHSTGISANGNNSIYHFEGGQVRFAKEVGVTASLSTIMLNNFSITDSKRGLSLFYSKGSVVSNSKFGNSDWGVWTFGSTATSLLNNEIGRQFGGGIGESAVIMLLSGNSLIKGNLIKANRFGIRQYNCSRSTIEENKISVNVPELGIASAGGILLVSQFSVVRNNTLSLKNVTYGIETNNCPSGGIFNNEIDILSVASRRTAAIRSMGSMGEKIGFNLISGSIAHTGILAQNTMGNQYTCNEINDTRRGIEIAFNSEFQDLRGNKMKAQEADLIIRSRIGSQLHKGNIFDGGVAIAEGLLLPDIEDSRFFVNPSFSGHLPSSVTPDQWFFPTMESSFYTCSGEAGPNLVSDPASLCAYYADLKSTESSDPERFVVRLLHLLRYNSLDESFVLPACISDDLNNLSDYCAINALTKSSKALDKVCMSVDGTENYASLQQACAAASTVEQRMAITNQMRAELATLNTAMTTARTTATGKLDSIEWSFNNLSCSSSLLSKWANIQRIYTKQLKGISLSDVDKTNIVTLSRMCSDEMGEGVHLARALANLHTNEYFDVYDDCLGKGEIDPKFLRSRPTVSGIELYPNPTAGLINIQLPADYSGRLMVTDLSGRLQLDRSVEGGMLQLNNFSKQSGLYFFRFISDQGVESTHKVVVLD